MIRFIDLLYPCAVDGGHNTSCGGDGGWSRRGCQPNRSRYLLWFEAGRGNGNTECTPRVALHVNHAPARKVGA